MPPRRLGKTAPMTTPPIKIHVSDGAEHRRPPPTYDSVQRETAARPYAASELNLSSCLAASPAFDVVRLSNYSKSIVVYSTSRVVQVTCLLKEWLVNAHHSMVKASPGAVRMETFSLHARPDGPGLLFFARDFALDTNVQGSRISALAVLPSNSQEVFWFWSCHTMLPIVATLPDLAPVNFARSWSKGDTAPQNKQSQAFARLFAVLRESFLKATQVPHDTEYAMALTIDNRDPDGHLPPDWAARLYGSKLISSKPWDLSGDRYLLKLSPPDQIVASHMRIHCSRYILWKRRFFAEYHSDREDKARQNAKGRPDKQWLVFACFRLGTHLRIDRAERLVAAWKALGWL